MLYNKEWVGVMSVIVETWNQILWGKLDFLNHVGNAQKGWCQQNYGYTYNSSWRNHPNFFSVGNQNQDKEGPNKYRSIGGGH